MAAQASSQNQTQGATQSQQNASNKTVASTKGGSLNAFASSIPSSKGKNADKIAQLQSELDSKQSSISANSNSINSFRTSSMNLFSNAYAYANNAKSVSASKKANNQNGQKIAQATSIVGATTTTTGGIITGVATLKMSNPITAAAGAALMPWGIGTTAAGGATTTAGSFAQGKATEGVEQAGQTTSNVLTGLAGLNNAKKTIA